MFIPRSIDAGVLTAFLVAAMIVAPAIAADDEAASDSSQQGRPDRSASDDPGGGYGPSSGAQSGEDAPTLDELLDLPSQDAADDAQPQPDPSDQPEAPAAGDGEADPPQEGQAPEPQRIAGDNPFISAVADMQYAAQRLSADADPGIDTQRAQERAIRRLNQLLDQLSQQQQQQSSSSSSQQQDTGSQQNQRQQQQQQGQSNQQATNSADSAREGAPRDGQRNDQALDENLSEWGNLPPRLRDQLLQGLEDQYSPLYRRMTERYYQRLAEEAQQ